MAARPRGGNGGIKRVGPSWYGVYREYASKEPNAKATMRDVLIGAAVGKNKITKTEARELMAAYMSRRGKGNVIPLSATLEQVWTRYSERYAATSKGHRKAMEATWRNHIAPNFGNYRLSEISRGDVRVFLEGFGDKKRTAQSARTLLSALFSMAVKHGIVRVSPVDEAAVRIGRATNKGTLTIEEVRAIAGKLEGDDVLKFYLFAVLALDRSAARALRRNDVLAEGLRIDEGYVEGSLTQLKTAKRHAIIPLPPAIAAMLAPFAADSLEWLWKADKGSGPWDAQNWLLKVLRPAATAAGITKALDLRMLRRTALTLARQMGASPEAAAGIGRHSVGTAMGHYWDATQAEPQRAALAAVVAGIETKERVM